MASQLLQSVRESLPRAGQGILRLATAVGLMLLCGCDPSINFYGSFFPGWTWCFALGLAGTILLRFLFAALRLERNLGPLMLVYPCLLLLLACAAWLLLFRY